ncbi:MAG: hypothetical protein IPQ12_09760 [Polaromonas sp.]|nr:hypothetical protein [Polaromonas sp.]
MFKLVFRENFQCALPPNSRELATEGVNPGWSNAPAWAQAGLERQSRFEGKHDEYDGIYLW